MPTNLPPEYFEAEQRYRAARSPAEKIASLEELISTIPKHKGTDHLRADLRRRLSKLKSSSQAKKSLSKRDSAFHIGNEGAGQVVVIGPTNVGKSALVAALTNATPEVSDAPYTTWQPTPGMMRIKNIQVQLVDTPPLNRDFVEPELLKLIRRSDVMALVVDLQTDPVAQLEDTIALLRDHHIVPCHLKEGCPEPGRLTFIPLLVLANKNDDESSDENFEILCQLLEDEWPLLPISAATRRNFDRLEEILFEQLGVIRVYTKAPGQEPDLNVPYALKKGSTVEDLAGKIHKDFVQNLKLARVWGEAVYDGQTVGRDYVLQDGDVVELHA